MSPQILNKVLNQNWFVAAQMKEIRRSTIVFEPSNAIKVLHGFENAAAKFIRTMGHHHKSMLHIVVYCLLLSLNCVKYVNCDIEPRPINNQFNDDDAAVGIAAHVSFVTICIFFNKKKTFPNTIV